MYGRDNLVSRTASYCCLKVAGGGKATSLPGLLLSQYVVGARLGGEDYFILRYNKQGVE